TRLGSTPPGLYQYEAINGYDAWALLHYGRDEFGHAAPLFLEGYGDWRGAVYTYLLAPLLSLLPPSAATLPPPPAPPGPARPAPRRPLRAGDDRRADRRRPAAGGRVADRDAGGRASRRDHAVADRREPHRAGGVDAHGVGRARALVPGPRRPGPGRRRAATA